MKLKWHQGGLFKSDLAGLWGPEFLLIVQIITFSTNMKILSLTVKMHYDENVRLLHYLEVGELGSIAGYAIIIDLTVQLRKPSGCENPHLDCDKSDTCSMNGLFDQ